VVVIIRFIKPATTEYHFRFSLVTFHFLLVISESHAIPSVEQAYKAYFNKFRVIPMLHVTGGGYG
jgi:hypothetical protein